VTFPAEQRDDLPVTAELIHEILMSTTELPGSDYRVLTYYVTAAALGDTVRKTAKDIGEELNLHGGSVGKSVKRLVDAEWLEFAYKVGKVPFYRVGPRVTRPAAAMAQAQDQPLAQVHQLPVRIQEDEE
jgi:hypothetical protein